MRSLFSGSPGMTPVAAHTGLAHRQGGRAAHGLCFYMRIIRIVAI